MDENPILDAPSEGIDVRRKQPFITGVLYVVAFYAGGGAVAWMSCLIFGHPYAHAPGPHHLILFATGVGGVGWIFIAVSLLLIGRRSPRIKAMIVANAAVLVVAGLYVYATLQAEQEAIREGFQESQDEILVTRNGDTSIILHNENIVYMKVKDSVLLNLIDSTNFPPDLVLGEAQ